MKSIVQRVQGSCRIQSRFEGREETDHFSGSGLVVLLGWQSGDENDFEKKEDWILSRSCGLRIFPDESGRMNLNLEAYLNQTQSSGGILWVPQFTLAAKLESGFRPSFSSALASDLARQRFLQFRKKLEQHKAHYKNIFGVFGADMSLSFTNWGPVTIPLEC